MVSSYSSDPMKKEPTVPILFRSLHADVIADQAIVTGSDFDLQGEVLEGPGAGHLKGIVDGLIRALQRREARS